MKKPLPKSRIRYKKTRGGTIKKHRTQTSARYNSNSNNTGKNKRSSTKFVPIMDFLLKAGSSNSTSKNLSKGGKVERERQRKRQEKERIMTRKMKKLKCSPMGDKHAPFDSTCLDERTILKLRDLWNLRHKDSPIYSNEVIEVWQQLQKKLSNVCNKESCWLKQQFVDGKMKKELEEYFAPVSPKEWKKNPNEWLSSLDISAVMKQYEKEYPCFDFIGPSPIDFDKRIQYGECVWQELCDFHVEKEMKNGKFKIGMIFNLDPHTKDGSHWVSMFINIKKGKIFFFDSTGDPVPKEVKVLVERIQKQGEQMNPPIHFVFDQNHPVEHQYGDTECGIYSLYFIVHMLEDKYTEEYFKTHILSDKYMEKFRKVYFNEDL